MATDQAQQIPSEVSDQDPAAAPPNQQITLQVKTQVQLMATILRATLQAATNDCPCSPCVALRDNARLLDPWLKALAGE